MRSRSKGHAAVGGVSTTLGLVGVGAGFSRAGVLSSTFLETPVWALSITAGIVLLLAGVCILLFSYRTPEETSDVVPAHVAFASRMNVEARPTPPPRAPQAAPPSAPGAKLPQPDAPAQKRVAPTRPDFASIDAKIRDLTRRINKAGVMLATGQLSQQGYLAYVDELKQERGKLEAVRVQAELRSS